MDGFAVRADDVSGADQHMPVQLQVVLDIPAGAVVDRVIGQGEAARIMTGAPLPAGADAVIPVEQTDSRWHMGEAMPLPATVRVFRKPEAGDCVRPAGEDVRVGQVVLSAGTMLRPQDIGVLAALGRTQIPVVRPPRVVIVSSGDELLDASEALAPGKIRDVNSYTLAGLVSSYGAQPIRLPIARDTLDDVRRLFRQAVELHPDVVISSAGVSVGAFDVVRSVLEEMGNVNFWRVNIRPGKPLAFGHLADIPFFGLPGNPVSAMVTFDVFVRPALMKLSRRPDATPTLMAITGEDIRSDGRRSYLRVTLAQQDGRWIARTTGTQSSGALMSMVLADGLVIIPEDMLEVPAGTALPVRLLRDPKAAL